jgi:hypothetical protein
MTETRKRMSENGGSEIKPRKIVINPLRPAIIVVFIILLVVACALFLSQRPWIGSYPTIGTNKGSTANTWTWTITAITDGGYIHKADVYVQVENASGFVIRNVQLTDASGTHGFQYAPGPYGNNEYLAVGDMFKLDKAYTSGSKIILVASNHAVEYCIMTV